MTNQKELNEKMADFIGLKKVRNARTILGDKTYVTEEIWVHRFDPLQDGQMIYNDNYPQKEIVKETDIIHELKFDTDNEELLKVWDHCNTLLVGLIRNGRMTPPYYEGSLILAPVLSTLFDIDKVKETILEFIDWYNKNKETFAIINKNP